MLIIVLCLVECTGNVIFIIFMNEKMAEESVAELKSEIAWYYLEELKNELGRLKRLSLLPIENEVKNIISWKWELSDKFGDIKEFWRWRNIINFFSPWTAERVYKFVKEKRENLISKSTREELLQFKNEILSSRSWDKKDDVLDNREDKEGNPQINTNKKYVYWADLTQKHLGIIWDRMKQKFPKTPLDASMIEKSCKSRANLPVEYLLAFMQNDSWLWTAGKWARTHNPWNVWNDDAWNLRTFNSWQEWVDACADNLKKRIDKYFKVSAECQWKWFNSFPTPEELATWKSVWWKKFFWIYMSEPSWPSRVASIVSTWNKDLMA